MACLAWLLASPAVNMDLTKGVNMDLTLVSVRLLAAAPTIATRDAGGGARHEDEHPRGPAERPAQREADGEAGAS